MNKLMGFYELKDSGLPAVPWKEFNENSNFNEDLLWTVRTAVNRGDDLNLPRIIGVAAEEAYNGALNLYRKFKDKGMVVYYPYFFAEKSGTLEVSFDKIVIEAVKGDLWNFVTYNKKDVSVIINGSVQNFDGNIDFLEKQEIDELKEYASKVRKRYRDFITEGKSLLLEWSYARDIGKNREPIGCKYLIFYEVRTI